MRVVDVTSFFSDSCGGIKTYYQAKARYLPTLGVDCHFVVPGKQQSEEAFEASVLHRLPGPRLPRNPNYRLFGRLRAVTDLVARLAPDVIEIGSHYLLPGALERLRWRTPGKRPRLFGFFHSDIARTLVAPAAGGLPMALQRPLMAGVWRWVHRQHARYDGTLVASRSALLELRDRGFGGLRWVGLGVDAEVFRPSPDGEADQAGATPGVPPTLVYAGRLSSDKNVSLLLAAWDGIHQRTGARLRVLGEGPQRGHLLRFAAQRPEVAVEGYLQDRGALARALGGANAVITPGGRETFSLGTAEALACGTPVIAPDSGGAGELVGDSGGGRCFRADDAGDLTAATVALLSLPLAERRALGQRGRAHILATYTWPAVMARLLEAYQHVDQQQPAVSPPRSGAGEADAA